MGCPTYAADLAEAVLDIAAHLREGGRNAWAPTTIVARSDELACFAQAICEETRKHARLKVRRLWLSQQSNIPPPQKGLPIQLLIAHC